MTRRPAGDGAGRSDARRGVTLLEVLVALTLLMAIMGSAMPLFVRHTRLLLETRQERIALEELANHAERIAALPVRDVTAYLAAIGPSDLVRRRLPGAVVTADRDRTTLGERVVVRIGWNTAGRREHPLSLAVWIAPPEVTP